MPDNLKRGLFSSRTLVAGIAVGLIVFIVALFALSLPSEIRRGEDGQRAIQMLDAMRRPFLKIKEAETRLIENEDVEAASADLTKGIESADGLIERYERLAAYNPEVSVRVAELAEEYGDWVSVERKLFDHISENKIPAGKGVAANAHFPGHINAASAAFLKTMDVLGTGEVPIHDDIDAGRRAVHKLLGLTSLLFLYLIGLVFYHQNRRTLALRRSRNELEGQIEMRKQIEETLKDERDYLEKLHNSLGEAVFTVKIPERTVEFVNLSVELIFGYRPEECVGQKTDKFYPESGAVEFGDKIKEAIKRGDDLLRTEQNLKRKNGEVFPAGITTTFFKENGKVTKVISIVRDITERKRAEEALRKSEERYRLLVDNIDMGITLIDKDYNVVMANRYQGEMFNKPSFELIGTNCFKEFEKREEVCSHCPGTRAMASGRPEVVDTEGVLDDGSKFFVHIKAFPVFDPDGQATGFVEVVENTTAQRRMEAEIHRAQKLESVGLLAGGIAHDFNNLLTGIVGNISIAKANLGSDKAFERLTSAENATAHATRLAQQLLTFSKGGEPIRESAYIRNLIKDSVSFVLSGSNIKCEYAIREDLWPVDIDTGQINQVFSNLAVNAMHAMPEGGLLNVSAENITIGNDDEDKIGGLLKKGQYIKISVEDNGTGIGKEHLNKIFDPYFSTKEGGSGLGLATSYSVIKKHDGHITVDSQLGVGTTFNLYLPASKELPIDKSHEKMIANLKGKLHKGIKVLLMDDEEIIRDVAGEMLTSSGYRVDFATDGDEAIELYRKAKESGEPFGAVIMDLTIQGGMGGREAIKKLLEVDPGAKVIVSSGYSNDPTMSNFKDYGFRGVIAKPYKIAELIAKVHMVITGEE